MVKALCLGATAVCIGRPYLYGLAARGPAGAQDVVEILRQEIRRTMTLMGVASVGISTPPGCCPPTAPPRERRRGRGAHDRRQPVDMVA